MPLAPSLDPHPAPSRLLVTGPPGSGKSRRAFEAFDAAVRADGPDAALLVLPTYGQVEHVKRLVISRRGDRPGVRGLLDASYATFTSLRERISPGFRVRALPSARRRDAVMRRALVAADAEPFRALRERPSFRARVLRLVKELKQSGLAPVALVERLRRAAAGLEEGPQERLRAFLDAFEAYERLLAEEGVVDHEDALRALVAEVRAPSVAARLPRTIVVDGFDDLSGIETSVLDAWTDVATAAGGRVVVTLPADDARADLFPRTTALRAHLAARDFREHRLAGFLRSSAPALGRLVGRLYAASREDEAAVGRVPATPHGVASPGTDAALGGGDAVASDATLSDAVAVTTIVAADPFDEWDRIGREVLRLARDGVRFRDVGVVLRRLDGRGTEGRRILEGLGIPVRLVGGGESLASQAVVRAVRGPLRVLAGDDGTSDRPFDGPAVLDWLRWLALEGGAADVAAVDRTDLRWRRRRMPGSLEALRDDVLGHERAGLGAGIERLLAARADVAASSAPADALARAIDALLPLPPSAGLDADGVPRDRAADARLARARAAKRRLVALASDDAPTSADGGGAPARSFAERAEDLLAAARETTSEPADRRLDAVSLLDAEEARHWELRVVFVAGLVERAFPLQAREDLFLRDEDREVLAGRLDADGGGAGLAWRTTRDAEAGERRLFLVAVSRARDRVVLTRAIRDESGRETTPSSVWAAVARALGRPVDGPDGFGCPRADVERAAPPLAEAATEHDVRRAVAVAVRRAPAIAAGLASDARTSPWLARAARFVRPTADPLPDAATETFLASSARLSPSSIQAALDCPHRFFLAHVARVPPDDAPLRGASADRRSFGTWIHAVLQAAVEAPHASVEALVEAVARTAVGVPDDADRAWFLGDLARIATLFREREALAAGSGFVPHAEDVEVVLGGAAGAVRLGGDADGFDLTGRVDRLDTSAAASEEGRAILVDYKTSPTTAKAAHARLRRSEELQLALYARALEIERGVTIVGLEHYAATSPVRAAIAAEGYEAAFDARRDAGDRARFVSADDLRERVRGSERRALEVVARVRLGARGGAVKDPLERSRCEECAFEAVCRPDVRRFRLRAERSEDRVVAPDGDDAGLGGDGGADAATFGGEAGAP